MPAAAENVHNLFSARLDCDLMTIASCFNRRPTQTQCENNTRFTNGSLSDISVKIIPTFRLTRQRTMGAEISYLHNERMHSVFFPVDNQVGHEENVIGRLAH